MMFNEWAWTRNEEDRAVKWPWIMLRNQASRGLGGAHVEVELSDYQRLPDGENLSPTDLLQGESAKADVITDLDRFFERLYNYYCGKGLWCIVTQWVVELLSLGFTICFSGFFLLIVNWHVLHTCGINAIEPCDLVREAVKKHPLTPFTFFKGIVVTYLALFSLYWVFCFLRFFMQLKEILEIRRFYRLRLGVSDRELQTTSWPALLDKIVQFQQHQRLCVIRELSVHDVVMRIMRKENYLIGMVNKGILAVPLPSWVPGSGPIACHDNNGVERRLVLTKTLEWSLNWCILQHMFDRNFLVRKDFINNPTLLRRRLMAVGLMMLLLSPFLIIFMFVYFFLRHAEQFYHHPSTAASRRWSNLAKWIFREFNELDHMFKQRLNCSYKHAVEYMKQFPSVILSLVAKFISFVAGGFAAILIIIAFLDESLLEAHLFGRNLFWFAAVFGTITAISRSAIMEEFQVFQPEVSLRLVACFTHYMPKHWRGAENKDSVRAEFESLFQYTGMMLLEELVSIFVTPYSLFFLLPKYVEDVLQFIKDFTVRIEGVGDVCSLSVFDFEHHGNSKYGSPFHTNKEKRSCQGKMEKSFLSFQSSYPNWEPDTDGKQFLSILADFQFQNNDPQLRAVSPLLQYENPLASRLQNSTFSLSMHPGHGSRWPVSYTNSIREHHFSGQFGQYREDVSLWGSKLVQDQLYWLVDRFYDSRSFQSGDRMARGLETQALGNRNSDYLAGSPCDVATSTICQEDISDRENTPIEADHMSCGKWKCDKNLAGQTSLCFSSKQAEGSQAEGSQRWVHQEQLSSLANGSFLEPPVFGAGHFAGSSYDSSGDGEDDQEKAWDLLHSRRAYTSSVLEDQVTDFDLPFGDLYDQPWGFHEGTIRHLHGQGSSRS